MSLKFQKQVHNLKVTAAEVCWTNYTRRVRRGKTSVVKFEALVESMKLAENEPAKFEAVIELIPWLMPFT